MRVCHGVLVGLAACSVVVCVCVSRPVGGTGNMQRSGVCVCHGLLVGLAACSVVVCVRVSRPVGGTGSMQRSGVCVCVTACWWDWQHAA